MEGYYEYRIVRIDLDTDDRMTQKLMNSIIAHDEEPALGDTCGPFEVQSVTALSLAGELIYTLRRKNY